MKTINANGNELIVVEVSDDAYDFNFGEMDNGHNIIDYSVKSKESKYSISNSLFYHNHKWIILCLLRDITESECERFVKYYSELYLYLDYTGKITGCNTAKESLISLLQSNGIDTSKNLILLTKN